MQVENRLRLIPKARLKPAAGVAFDVLVAWVYGWKGSPHFRVIEQGGIKGHDKAFRASAPPTPRLSCASRPPRWPCT